MPILDVRTSTALTLIIVALGSTARTATAQPYLTAAAGVGRNDVECTVGRTCEKDDVAYKILGGYRLVPWIAAEAVYIDFGEARKATALFEESYGTSAFGGGLALHGRFASWTVTLRAGAAAAINVRGIVWGPGFTGTQPDDFTTVKVMPYGGAGLGYRVSEYLALGLEFDVTRSKWERSDGASLAWNVGAVTAGLTIGR